MYATYFDLFLGHHQACQYNWIFALTCWWWPKKRPNM